MSGFDRYLIFDLPHENGIDVIRVLHGARDIDGLFAEEEASPSSLDFSAERTNRLDELCEREGVDCSVGDLTFAFVPFPILRTSARVRTPGAVNC